MDRHEEKLRELARQIRRDTIRMIQLAGSGHPGGALGAAEILAVLYGHTMRHSPENPGDPERDRLVLSNGHICAAWYSVLARCGYLPLPELATFRKIDSRLPGHPARSKLPEVVEHSSGPLGQGVPVAKGIAQANRYLKSSGRVYCLVGDGEMQEGIVWESMLSAAQHAVDNLTLIVSYNGMQLDGEVPMVKDIQPIDEKFRSFRWHVQNIDGHSISELISALNLSQQVTGQPTVIIAYTVMGKGVPYMENRYQWHGRGVTQAEAEEALRAIGTAQGYTDFPTREQVIA